MAQEHDERTDRRAGARPAGSESRLLGIPEAAAYLGFHPRTLSDLARSGRVPAKKVGGVWRFHLQALEAWLTEGTGAALPATEVLRGRGGRAGRDTDHPLLLVVEDDPSQRQLIATSLEEQYQVRTAEDGAIALLEVGLHRPDLIVLDLMLPRVNGLDVCRILRARPEFNQTAILMLSGVGDVEQTVEALNLGADDYVTKPFRPIELQARIRRLIERTHPQLQATHP